MTIGQSMVIHKSVTAGGVAEMSAHPRNAEFIEFDVAYDEVRRAIRPITGCDSTSGERIRYLEGNER